MMCCCRLRRLHMNAEYSFYFPGREKGPRDDGEKHNCVFMLESESIKEKHFSIFFSRTFSRIRIEEGEREKAEEKEKMK